jgi:hypothetical protein
LNSKPDHFLRERIVMLEEEVKLTQGKKTEVIGISQKAI